MTLVPLLWLLCALLQDPLPPRLVREGVLRLSDEAPAHAGAVHSLALHPDGRRLLSAGEDGALRLWDVEAASLLGTWDGHPGAVAAVAWIPGQEQALSAGADPAVRLWDAEQGNILATWSGHEHPVTSVAVAPDGARALSGDEGGWLILWEVAEGSALRRWQGHESQRGSGVTRVAFHPDGRRALTSSWYGKTVALWDLEREEPLWADTHWKVTGHAFHPEDPERALTAGVYDDLVLWDLAEGTQLAKWRPRPSPEFGEVLVAFTKDGRFAVSAGWTDTVILWDVAAGKEVHRLVVTERPTDLFVSGDLIWVGTQQGPILCLHLDRGGSSPRE